MTVTCPVERQGVAFSALFGVKDSINPLPNEEGFLSVKKGMGVKLCVF